MTQATLTVGDPAPDFALTADDGSTVRLSDFAGRKVIVYFYPAAMTPGCTTEACEFTAARDDLDTAGYSVIGISPDAPSKLATFAQKSSLEVTLLSDPDRAVAAAWGAYGEKKNYGKTIMGIIRSTFVVGADGKVEQAWRNVKATGHVARVLKELGVAA